MRDVPTCMCACAQVASVQPAVLGLKTFLVVVVRHWQTARRSSSEHRHGTAVAMKSPTRAVGPFSRRLLRGSERQG